MRLNEFKSPLKKFLATVKVSGTTAKTIIDCDSASLAQLLLGKMFGKANVISVSSLSLDESVNALRLLEYANAEDQVKLWQIISQSVFQAIEKERREAEEAERLEASKPKKSRAVQGPSRSVTAPKTVRPKTVKPQVAKPQTAKSQAVPLKKSIQTSPQARTQQSMLPRTHTAQSTTQPKQRLPQVTQQPTQQQQIAQINRKLYPHVLPS
jgi:hypothetical protein